MQKYGYAFEYSTKKPALGFCEEAFQNSFYNCLMLDKEGFAIIKAMICLNIITHESSAHFFTNHLNVSQMYDPAGTNQSVSRYVPNNLMCWAKKLSYPEPDIEYRCREDVT